MMGWQTDFEDRMRRFGIPFEAREFGSKVHYYWSSNKGAELEVSLDTEADLERLVFQMWVWFEEPNKDVIDMDGMGFEETILFLRLFFQSGAWEVSDDRKEDTFADYRDRHSD